MSLVLAGPGPGWVALLATTVGAALALLCLRTLGHNLFLAVRWHNLKVQAHNLRLRQRRELLALRRQAIVKEARRLSRGAAATAPSDARTELGEATGDESRAQAA